MADKDISLKQLEAYPKVFADIVNVLMFDGKKVVNPDALVDANIKSQYKFLDRLHEEERDVAKFCQDGNIRICMMGLENQTTVEKFESDFKIIAEYYWQKKHKKNFQGTDMQIEYVDAFLKTMTALTGDYGYVELLQNRGIAEKIAQGGVSVCEMLEKIRQKGRAEGRAEGEAKGVLQSVRNLMKNLKWTAEAAMNAVGVAPADRPAILAAL